MDLKLIKEIASKGIILSLLIIMGKIAYLFLFGDVFSHFNPIGYFNPYLDNLDLDWSLNLLVLSLFFSIPLSVSIALGKRSLEKEISKKIFYKMPLYSLISSIIIFFIIMFIIPDVYLSIYLLMGTVLNMCISFPFALYYYAVYYHNNEKIKYYFHLVPIVLLFIFIIYNILSIILIFNYSFCDSHLLVNPHKKWVDSHSWCNLEKALKYNSPAVCSNDTEFGVYGNNEEYTTCLTWLAIKKNDITLCEYINDSGNYWIVDDVKRCEDEVITYWQKHNIQLPVWCSTTNDGNSLIKGKIFSNKYPHGKEDYCSEDGITLRKGRCSEKGYGYFIDTNCLGRGSGKCQDGACIT